MSSPRDDDRFEALVDELVRRVDGNGWTAMFVSPDPGDALPHSIAYTVGFWPAHREMIAVNMPFTVAGEVLATAHQRVQDGETFEPGQRYSRLIANFDVAFRDVSVEAQGQEMKAAEWYHRRLGEWPFAAVQMLWPDEDGRFPGERGYDDDRFPQPLL